MDPFLATANPTTLVRFRLPVARSSIIGRQRERARVAEILRDGERLVTLAGAGGVGKTRLALAIADELRPEFDDRVGWVSLGELTEPDLLADTIARALDIATQGKDPIDTIAAAIGDLPALLVIDNMEHLTEASGMLATLLDRSPALSLLVTSRAPLRLMAEREIHLSPFPAIAAGAALESHPAVELFIERARAVDATFRPNDEALTHIAAIVAQVDFLPLAIELAAARVRHFSLEEIASLLSQNFDLLTGGPRDAPDRQRTIRATIGWSYALLSPAEQYLFRTLSVFPGPFTLERALRLTEGGDSTRVETIESISTLVDQNLLIRLAEPGPGRYVMLGSIREFGQAQLAGSGEEQGTRARFADLVMERVTPPGRYPSEDVAWLETVEHSLGDVRAVLAWLLATGAGERALELALSLNGWWNSRGNPREGMRAFASALALEPVTSDLVRFNALRKYSWLLALTGSLPRASEFVPEIETLARRLDDPIAMIQTEQLLGAFAFVAGDFETGRSRTTRAIELAEAHSAMSEFKGLLFNMATLSESIGDYDLALDYHRRGMALLDREANPGFYAMHLTGMASLALRTANPGEADRLIRLAWSDIVQLRDRQFLSSAILVKCEVLLEFGDPVRAVQLFGAAEREIEQYGRILTETELGELDEVRRRVVDSLPADDLQSALMTGRSLSLDDISGIVVAPITPARARPEPSLLTPRETEVTRLLVEGKTNPEIAAELFISERTVQSHVANIMAKLGVNSRTAVAARAVREGMLPA